MGVWMALHQGPATADVCMIIGSNPLISIAAGLPQADPRKWLHDAKKRGFKLIVIDPRRHETASRPTSTSSPSRPRTSPSSAA